MNWTRPSDLRREVERLWQRGSILRSLLSGEKIFPYRLRLRSPSSSELGECFGEVRQWIGELDGLELFRIEWRALNHRTLGSNQVPAAIWVDTLEDAVGIVGKQRSVREFEELVKVTREVQPELLCWLEQYPMRGLKLKGVWRQLLDVVQWVEQHPCPGIYLRELDLPGVHTKLVEQHRGVLAELLDLVVASEFVRSEYRGVAGFCKRYGFREKPRLVRLRSLDKKLRFFAKGADQEMSITEGDFAALDLPVKRVFVTENEVNFLTMPSVVDSIVVFGRGYGVEVVAGAAWLQEKRIYYWGDIDTHGFAILSQLRRHLPQVESMLMDEGTLMAHREFWVRESEPSSAVLNYLTMAESQLYRELQQGRWGVGVRLEQERIRYSVVRDWVKLVES